MLETNHARSASFRFPPKIVEARVVKAKNNPKNPLAMTR
jgi:hypothetical protein